MIDPFLLQITFFHPWKDYKTTRKYPLKNLKGNSVEAQLSHADKLLNEITEEIYYITGGQGILEGKIFYDKKAKIVRSLHEQCPPPSDGHQAYTFLNYVLAIKFSYQVIVPRPNGTIFRKGGSKTINIPSLFSNPLVQRGTKTANLREPMFQKFASRFGEIGNLGLDKTYDSWGNVVDARFKMLASVKKENKRSAKKRGSSKAVSSNAKQFVYLIHIHENIYKIGKSKDPEKRLKALQTSSPYKLVLAHSFEADNVNSAEQELHQRLESVRQEGEWFILLDEQKDVICRILEFKDGKFWTHNRKKLDENLNIVDGVDNS